MTVGLLAVSVLLIAVNGFFVAAEFALLVSRVTRLEPMAENGDDAGASAALEAVQDLQPQLVGAQLGITMASLGLGHVGEPAVASLIESAVDSFVELPAGCSTQSRSWSLWDWLSPHTWSWGRCFQRIWPSPTPNASPG